MKTAREWQSTPLPSEREPLILEQSRDGAQTLRSGDIYLHSRYNPGDEARRLIASAELQADRPVLVIGLGLGHHVLELAKLGIEVAVVEPDEKTLAFAVEGPMKDSEILIGVGDPNAMRSDPKFVDIASTCPQLLIHPPTNQLHPGYADAITEEVTALALANRRLSIAIVGPMYGGSLPIASYLHRACTRLGHRSLFVDNSLGWELFDGVRQTVRTPRATEQLSTMLTNVLSEWTYARVMEFAPDLCIVLAQAPVQLNFPQRLREQGVVSAYWFVENWRHFSYWRDVAPLYDCFFHMQGAEFEEELRALNLPHTRPVPMACDPEIHAPVDLAAEEAPHYTCDISFAGAGYANRQELFKGLTDLDFRIWGVEWAHNDLQHCLVDAGQRFTPETFAKIVSGSKINLNLHASKWCDGVDPDADAVNPRVFEVAACGGFQLCDPCGGLDALFDPGDEIPVYKNLSELRELIAYYLEHSDEREAIAAKARRRVLDAHTYEHRADEMIAFMIARRGAQILRKGLRVQRTIAEVADSQSDDEDLAAYLGGLPADALFTYENVVESCTASPDSSRSEKIFAYLREIRTMARSLPQGQ